MRYFSYNEYDENGGHVVTLSEDEIRDEYYTWWYEQMCRKYGKLYVDDNYCFEDCLLDWISVHWAWEVKD